MDIDLGTLFMPSLAPLEIVIRGAVTYVALFLLMRVTLKRQAGAVGDAIEDLLTVGPKR